MKKTNRYLTFAVAIVVLGGMLSEPGRVFAEKKATADGKKNSVSISGTGTVKRGSYHQMDISGSGTLEDGVTADVLNASGGVSSKGKLRVDEIYSSGDLTAGELSAHQIASSGHLGVEGSLESESLVTSGAVEVGKNLKSSALTFSGVLSIKEDATVVDLEGNGSLNVAGKLSAKTVRLGLDGKSSLGSVRASRFEARNVEHKTLKLLGLSHPNILTADCIEAETVSLENTEAKVVKGAKVKIGKSCKIGLVEYGDSLEVAKGANVEKKEKK